MLTYFWIMLGGALGSGARYWASGLVGERFGEVFPLGTLFVNISGSFLIGFLVGLTEPPSPFPAGPRLRQFLMIGILGGYTTFSPYSYETLELMTDGNYGVAVINVFVQLVLGLIGVYLGVVLGHLIGGV